MTRRNAFHPSSRWLAHAIVLCDCYIVAFHAALRKSTMVEASIVAVFMWPSFRGATGPSAVLVRFIHSTPRLRRTNAPIFCVGSIPSFRDAAKTDEALHLSAIFRVGSILAARDLLSRRQPIASKGGHWSTRKSAPILSFCAPLFVQVHISFVSRVAERGRGRRTALPTKQAWKISYWIGRYATGC